MARDRISKAGLLGDGARASMRAAIVLAVVLTAFIGGARAQLIDSAPSASSGWESRSIGPGSAGRASPVPGIDASSSAAGWMRTGLALAGVVALIFAARLVVIRLGGRGGSLAAESRAPSGVLEVLGRYPAARGVSFLLLRMDRRILLLAQSSAGVSTLAEVTDPEEVASLLLKTRDEEGESNAKRFNELLRHMGNDPSILEEERGGDPTPRRGLRLGEVRA